MANYLPVWYFFKKDLNHAFYKPQPPGTTPFLHVIIDVVLVYYLPL